MSEVQVILVQVFVEGDPSIPVMKVDALQRQRVWQTPGVRDGRQLTTCKWAPVVVHRHSPLLGFSRTKAVFEDSN